MNSEEAVVFQDWLFPVVNHKAYIPLPERIYALLSIPASRFNATLKNTNGDMAHSRQATRSRMVPHDHPSRTRPLDGRSETNTSLGLER